MVSLLCWRSFTFIGLAVFFGCFMPFIKCTRHTANLTEALHLHKDFTQVSMRFVVAFSKAFPATASHCQLAALAAFLMQAQGQETTFSCFIAQKKQLPANV